MKTLAQKLLNAVIAAITAKLSFSDPQDSKLDVSQIGAGSINWPKTTFINQFHVFRS
jgi:hypothetical protein